MTFRKIQRPKVKRQLIVGVKGEGGSWLQWLTLDFQQSLFCVIAIPVEKDAGGGVEG